MKYLALDIGEKVVGVAGSDSGIVAMPMDAINMSSDFMAELGKLIESEKPEIIVFGLPTHQNGEENGLAADIRQLAEGVKHEFNVTVEFEDEYGTTIEAEKILRELGVAESEIEKYDDSVAATIILENYFARK